MTVLRRLFGLDLRSIAAFRVAVSLVVLGDLAARAPDIQSFYTDSGILPRRDLLDAFAFLHDWPICLNLISGSYWSQVALFGLTALAALALLAGYRSRVACAVCWLLMLSLQLRNLYVGHGSDAQVRLALLWGCFLPLGARFSLDRALFGEGARREARPPASNQSEARPPASSQSEARPPAANPSVARREALPPASRAAARGERGPTLSNQYLSVGAVAFTAQIVILYLATGHAKSLLPYWRDGTAVAWVFDDELFGTTIGLWARNLPWVCAALTYLTLVLELAGPVLLFVPIANGPIRTFTVLGLMAMHLGFSVGLRVGVFPYVSIACLVALLPGWFWDALLPALHGGRALEQETGRFSRAIAGLRSRLDAWTVRQPHPRRPVDLERRAPWREALCALLLGFTVIWNYGVWLDPDYVAPPSLEWLGKPLFMQQDWRMFAHVSTRTGWVVVPGQLRDGTEVDLFKLGGPVPDLDDFAPGEGVSFAKPASPRYKVKNYRWLGMMSRLVYRKRGDAQLLHYARYLCRNWNASHEGAQQLETLQIVFMARPTRPEPWDAAQDAYEREVLWEHGCFR